MHEAKYTPISRGWLGFWSLIYSIVLIVGAVGLGFALTFGRPSAVYRVLTDRRSLPAIEAKVNSAVLAVAQGQGLELPADTPVTPKRELKSALKTGLAISANFNEVPASSMVVAGYVARGTTAATPLDVTLLTNAITARIAMFAQSGDLAYSGEMRTQTEAQVQDMMQTKIIKELMLQGWGLVYPMLILVVQTAAIVGGILAVIALLIMLYCSHNWQRWFKVAGRVTYVTGFLGGFGAMVVGTRTFTDVFGGSVGGLDPIVFHQLLSTFAPTWQRLAGIVVLIGLSLALVGQVMRLMQRRKATVKE
ncbi:hypothetical protein [Lacticaseibacillus daqingensis]|uniref:hypothetical protein n=1 Tax=Lacticaseibacillus daqingensis TaxID=2486014 RepID=UPI000F7BB051|nr:hypothetical protein [Lacticaseibacillus daqingensis]